MSAGQPFISDSSPCAFWDKVRGNDPFQNGPMQMGPDGFPFHQERHIETTKDQILDLLEYVVKEWKSEYPGSMNREDIEKEFYNKFF